MDTERQTYKSEYGAWINAKHRCCNPNHKDYGNYGARGIRVCDEWLSSFSAFLDHIGPKPGNDYSLDRLDNDRGYYPSNVAWRTRSEQQLNRRTYATAYKITINGRTQSIRQWANESGLHHATLQTRLRKGWEGADLLLPPHTKRGS